MMRAFLFFFFFFPSSLRSSPHMATPNRYKFLQRLTIITIRRVLPTFSYGEKITKCIAGCMLVIWKWLIDRTLGGRQHSRKTTKWTERVMVQYRSMSSSYNLKIRWGIWKMEREWLPIIIALLQHFWAICSTAPCWYRSYSKLLGNSVSCLTAGNLSLLYVVRWWKCR